MPWSIDALGLLRTAFAKDGFVDFTGNEHKMSEYFTDGATEAARAMILTARS